MNFITRLILFKVAGLLGCLLSVTGALLASIIVSIATALFTGERRQVRRISNNNR